MRRLAATTAILAIAAGIGTDVAEASCVKGRKAYRFEFGD